MANEIKSTREIADIIWNFAEIEKGKGNMILSNTLKQIATDLHFLATNNMETK